MNKKEFTYHLAIKLGPEEQYIIADGLYKLGYSAHSAFRPSYDRWNYLVTRPGQKQIDNIYNAIIEIEVPTECPELFLALAAMTKDNIPHVGETVVGGGASVPKGIIHTISQVDEKGVNFNLVERPMKGGGWASSMEFYRKATLEEIVEKFGCVYNKETNKITKKNNMKEEKELIGYKLIKTEYEKAAVLIGSSLGFAPFNGLSNISYTRDKRIVPLNGFAGTIDVLKKAGVLDIWFEPVYKETKKEYSLRCDRNIFKVKVENGYVSSEDDHITFRLDVIKAAIAPRSDKITAFSGSVFFTTMHPERIDIGCKKGILVKDIQEMLDDIEKNANC